MVFWGDPDDYRPGYTARTGLEAARSRGKNKHSPPSTEIAGNFFVMTIKVF